MDACFLPFFLRIFTKYEYSPINYSLSASYWLADYFSLHRYYHSSTQAKLMGHVCLQNLFSRHNDKGFSDLADLASSIFFIGLK